MIDITILPLFIVSTLFLVISPGPDLLLISAYSSAQGFRAGVMIALGIFVAGLAQTLLVAFGLGQLMQAMPPLIWGIKIVGALYLSWIGLNLLRTWLKNGESTKHNKELPLLSSKQLMCRGLLNNLMNPKALLFFSMFLPQFTNTRFDLSSQIMVLGVLLSALALTINTAFAFSFSQLGTLIGNKLNLSRHMDGVLGLVFLGLATRLVTDK